MSLYARLALLAAAVLLVLGIGWKVRHAGYVAGKAEVRQQWDAERVRLQAEMQAQLERNRELQRAAERNYVVQAGVRDRVITETITEIRYAAAPMAACPVPEPVRLRLNAAAACARGDRSAACDADKPVPDAR